MSENKLPVLWVPPVPPQVPEDRPPRAGRRPQIVTLAALLIGTPILAWATMTGADEPTERAAVATVAEATAKPVVPQAAKAPAPEAEKAPTPIRFAGTATSAGPATAGGARPYPPVAPRGARAEPPANPGRAPAAAPAAVDAAGHPVRVIDMNQRSDGDATAEPKPVPPPVATATPQPAAEKPDTAKAAATDAKTTTPPHRPATAKDEPKPPVTPPTPVAAKVPASPAPSELRSTIDTPPATAHAGEAPSVAAPKPTDTATSRDETPGHAPEIAAKPTPEMPVTAKPATVTSAPKPGSAPTSVVTVAPPATPKKPTKIPEPRPKDAAPSLAGGPGAAAHAESRDFADRLAAVRREEGRRLRAAPPPIEDDEVVVVPRRGWSIFPSFEDEAPARPVLRPFEAPPRVAERPVSHSNCHFHAWPTEEMEFHRDVQCHWHRNARDTSLRYVR